MLLPHLRLRLTISSTISQSAFAMYPRIRPCFQIHFQLFTSIQPRACFYRVSACEAKRTQMHISIFKHTFDFIPSELKKKSFIPPVVNEMKKNAIPFFNRIQIYAQAEQDFKDLLSDYPRLTYALLNPLNSSNRGPYFFLSRCFPILRTQMHI